MEKKKILVTDDSKVTLAIIAKQLNKLGYFVETSTSALDSAEKLKNSHFDLLLTDLNMPEINGIELLLWVRKNQPDCKVIMMTSFEAEEAKNFASKSGAISYFKKKDSFSILEEIIEQAFKEKNIFCNIKDINLFDFLKLLSISNKNKVISINTYKNEQKGLLFFKEGNIIHAEIDNIEGDGAFFKIARLKTSYFEDLGWYEPKKQTIFLPFDSLLISSAQLMDEINLIKEVKPNILLIDDSEISLKVLGKQLKNKNYNFETTTSPIEAIHKIYEKDFNLVITDNLMPEMNGTELYLKIKKLKPQMPIILISASITEVLEFQQQNKSVIFLQKPVPFEKLEEHIKNIFSNKSFIGKINGLNIVDFIQIASLSSSNKLISIIERLHERESLIYLKKGKLVHAKYGKKEGDKAFIDILNIENCIIEEREWKEPEKETIKTNMSKLIMQKLISQNKFDDNIPDIYLNDIEAIKLKTDYNFLDIALKRKKFLENNSTNKNIIGAYSNFMSLIVGKSTKNDAINLFTKEFNIKYADHFSRINENILEYSDLGISIKLDKKDIIEAIYFFYPYLGKTENNLEINDYLDKFLFLYNIEKIKNKNVYTYENLAFYTQDLKNITAIKIMNKNDSSFKDIDKILKKISKHLLIDEKGSFLDIEINNATYHYAIDKILEYTPKEKFKKYDNYIYFEKNDITLLFNELGIVEEIQFGNNENIITKKGIKIGDNIYKAFDIYGEPRLKTFGMVVWDKLSLIFQKNGEIISMSLGSI
ncbi:MAG: response regulator [Candidatus Sericytochromatia bacterium]